MNRWPPYWHDFPEIPERAQVECDRFERADGAALFLCHIGRHSRECFVMIMSPMTPVLLMLPTLVKLSQVMPVLTWEQRDFAVPPGAPVDHSFDAYVKDVEAVVAAAGVRTSHVITFCASVDIGVEFAVRSPHNVRSMAAIAPLLHTGRGRGLMAADTGAVVERILVEIANSSGDREATLFQALKQFMAQSRDSNGKESPLQRLMRLNMRSPQHIRRRIASRKSFFQNRAPGTRLSRFHDVCRKFPTHALFFEGDSAAGTDIESIVPDSLGVSVDIQPQPRSGFGLSHYAPFLYPDAVSASLLRFYRSVAILESELG